MQVAFVGDVMLGRLVNERLRGAPPEYPWGNTLALIRGADVNVCNLECVLSDGGAPARKEFTFRSDANNVRVLAAAGIDLVSLANNHTLDYGPEALADMLGILDYAGIAHAGAGAHAAEARALAQVRVDGTSVGMLSVTDNEPGWEARAKEPGTWFVPVSQGDPRAKDLFARVTDAKRNVGVLIVSLHWGANWRYEPEAEHRDFAHALIDVGADIVFGHSSHAFRGIEMYASRPILFGAGDFIDDYAVDKTMHNDESFVYSAEVAGGRATRVRLYPTVIRGLQAQLADAPRARSIAARMKKLCNALGTKTAWVEREGALEVQL